MSPIPAEGNVVIRIRVDDDVASKLAKIRGELTAFKRGVKDVDKETSKSAKTIEKLTSKVDDLEDKLRHSNNAMSKFDKSVNKTNRSTHGFFGTLRKVLGPLRFFVYEAGLATVALGAMKIAFISAQAVAKGFQIAMQGVGAAAASAVAALSTALAAIREMKNVQLGPLFGNQTRNIAGNTSGILGNASFGAFSDDSLLQGMEELRRAGFQLNSEMSSVFSTLGNFAASGVGDPSKKLTELVTTFTAITSTGKITAETVEALKKSAPELAAAVGQMLGGKGTAQDLIKVAESATEKGEIAAGGFIEGLLSNKFDILKAYEGQLDRINDTLIGRLKGQFRSIKETLTDIGTPLVDSLKGPVTRLGNQLRASLVAVAPVIQSTFPQLGGQIEDVLSKAMLRLVVLIAQVTPKLVGLKDKFMDLFYSVKNYIQNSLMPTLERFAGYWDSFWDAFLGPFVKGAAALLIQWLESFGKMTDEVSGKTRTFGADIQEIFKALGNFVEEFNKIRTMLEPLFSALIGIVATVARIINADNGLGAILRLVGGLALGYIVFMKIAHWVGEIAKKATVSTAALNRLNTAVRSLGMAEKTTGLGGAGGKGPGRLSGVVSAVGLTAMLGGGMLQQSGNSDARVAGGALVGASTGAMVGSMIAPGWGTAIGAGVGALGGGYMSWRAEKAAAKKKREEERAARVNSLIVSGQGDAQSRSASLQAMRDRLVQADREQGSTTGRINELIGTSDRSDFQKERLRKMIGEDAANELLDAEKRLRHERDESSDAIKTLDKQNANYNFTVKEANRFLGLSESAVQDWAQSVGYDMTKSLEENGLSLENFLNSLDQMPDKLAEALPYMGAKVGQMLMDSFDAVVAGPDAKAALDASWTTIKNSGPMSADAAKDLYDGFYENLATYIGTKVASGEDATILVPAQQKALEEMLKPGGALGGLDPANQQLFRDRVIGGLSDFNSKTQPGSAGVAEISWAENQNRQRALLEGTFADLYEVSNVRLSTGAKSKIQGELRSLGLVSTSDPAVTTKPGSTVSRQRMPVGDTATSRFGRTMSSAMRAGRGISGRRSVTSGIRGWGLGSGSSDHLSGRALDVTGQNLGAYARSVQAQGGFAEFHGTGGDRHLHLVPAGDTATPRSTGGGMGVGSLTVSVNVPAGNWNEQTLAQEVTRRVINEISRMNRSDEERR